MNFFFSSIKKKYQCNVLQSLYFRLVLVLVKPGLLNVRMASMDSPLFDYVVFYFLLKLHRLEETFVAHKKCEYDQSGT